MPNTTGTILCLCAHSDDEIFGPGATLAKYASEGKDIYTIIFSYGELSHPHFKEDVIIKTRVKEAEAADKIIGGAGVTFLGLREGKFLEEAKEQNTIKQLVAIMRNYQPEKIFTHANDDPHPDHKAVFALVKEAYDKSGIKSSVYTFDVWTPFSTKKRDAPKLVVDVSDTFGKKLKAIQCFTSQLGVLQMGNWYVWAQALWRGFSTGLHYGYKFGEVFYKLR